MYLCMYRWPPLSYIKAMEEYKEKYGIEEDGDDDTGSSEGEEGRAGNGGSRKTGRGQRNRNKNCTIM